MAQDVRTEMERLTPPEPEGTHLGQSRKANFPWMVISIGLLLLAYTTVRAISVSFSWDESWTYIHHVSKAMFYQQAYDKMGGNHHLLNVWLMWLSSKLFGDGTLALRLPNLMAHAVYLYATGRIALKARSRFLAVAVFLLLNLHPYLLDFFSLARGYGLGCGWMMLSLWHVWRYFDEGQSARQVLWAAIYASLSAMSHVIMINFLLALGLAFLIIWAAQVGRTGLRAWKRYFLVLCVASAVGLALILPNALGLFNGGSLNFGCDTFWDCMIGTLGQKVLYHMPYTTPVLRIMAITIMSVALVCALTLAMAVRGGWLPRTRPMVFGALILGGCLLSFFLQQKLFQVPLPQSRTGLLLLPLLAYVLATALVAWPRSTWPPCLAAGILCIPMIVHQYNSANLAYVVEWKSSGEVAHMLGIITKDHLPLTEERPIVTLCSSFESWGSIPYYQRTLDMEWLVTTTRRPPEPYVPSEYYIVEYDGYYQVDTVNWKLMYRSEATNTTLYRDERWRNPDPEVLFREIHFMESRDLPGRSTVNAVSGTQSVRFDTLTRSTASIRWVVPSGLDSTKLEFTGSGMVLQPDDSNWLSILLTVTRDGKEVSHADVSSAIQTKTFGEWNRIGVSLHPTAPLRKDDVVELSVWPLTSDTPIYLDDLELNVLH